MKPSTPSMLGTRVGHWVLVSVVNPEATAKRRVYMCLCDCGNMKGVSRKILRAGKSRSCGCKSKHLGAVKNTLPDNAAIVNSKYDKLRRGASERGHDVSIDKEQFKHLMVQNCHYCNCAPNQFKFSVNPNRLATNGPFMYHGLDRVDNSVGYHKGNVVTCCRDCNYMKGRMSYEDFKAKVQQIARHTLASLS